jgi:hypothetical protein
MKELTKIVVVAASTAALVGGIGAGLAYADTPTDEPTTSPTVTTTTAPADTTPTAERDDRDRGDFRKRQVRRQLRFMARALHGEVTLAGEKHKVIVFQRGTVEKANSKSVTVKSNDGFVDTYLLSDDTKIREYRKDATVSDIDTSDRVLVVATKDDSTLNARRVIVREG